MPGFDLKHYADVPRDLPLFILEKDGKMYFLLGTTHDIPLQVLPPLYSFIIKMVKALIVEFEVQPTTEESLLEVGIITKEEGQWFEKMSKEAQQILKKYWDAYLALNHIAKPIPVSRLDPGLSDLICEVIENEKGMDSELEKKFASEVYGLEKRLDVKGYLDKLKKPIADVEKLLIKTYGENAEVDPTEVWVNTVYLSGLTFYFPEFSALQENDEVLVVARNQAWMARFSQLHKELQVPTLIAVGHAHLPGKSGLLNLMFEAGFKISFINAGGELRDYSIFLIRQELGKILGSGIDNDNEFLSQFVGSSVRLISEYAEDAVEVVVTQDEIEKGKLFTPGFVQRRIDENNAKALAKSAEAKKDSEALLTVTL